MKLQTTLAIIRPHNPCTSGWEDLLRHLGPKYPQDKPIAFGTILESNGLDDALWGLRAVLPEQEKDRDRLARLFACDCAESVLHLWEAKYPYDKRPREAIAVSRRFALGQATQEELSAARDAARDAAWDAWAAAGAAGEVAWDAALDAAWAAARAAARDAARAAAWAAEAAAWAAAWAARDAARAAAGAADAAWAAAWAADAAARAAARDAARDAAWAAFKDKFILYFCTDRNGGGIACAAEKGQL